MFENLDFWLADYLQKITVLVLEVKRNNDTKHRAVLFVLYILYKSFFKYALYMVVLK